MTVPKGCRAKPTHCSGPDSTVVFNFFPVFYFSAWPGKDSPSSCIFTCLGASRFKSVCHAPVNHSWKLTPFSEHIPLGSQGSLRMIPLEVLWRRHWGKKNITNPEEFKIRAQGWNLCPQTWLLLVFFSSGGIWLFWRLLGCLHSLLLLSIQQRAPMMYQTLLHKASPGVKWKPRQSHHGNMPFHMKSACARPPDPKKTRDECVYWVSSHCPSNHQIPFTKSGSRCALNVHHLLCSVLFLKTA